MRMSDVAYESVISHATDSIGREFVGDLVSMSHMNE